MTILESGWNLWVWLVGGVSRRWVWLVGGIYGYGYNVSVWLVGVVIRRYIDILIIIINFPYSTCIRSFLAAASLLLCSFLNVFSVFLFMSCTYDLFLAVVESMRVQFCSVCSIHHMCDTRDREKHCHYMWEELNNLQIQTNLESSYPPMYLHIKY